MRKKPSPELIDDENPEWTVKQIAKAHPRASHPKERINIRLSHNVVTRFKASGGGWKTRINVTLQD